MENKREVALLIPYQIRNNDVFVFLQKRSKTFRVLSDHFSFFGGKLEPGENPEQALNREIKEELNIAIKDYSLLGVYQSPVAPVTLNVYVMQVAENFEKTIVVSEGEYGKFFSKVEIAEEQMLIDSDKKIIQDLWEKVR